MTLHGEFDISPRSSRAVIAITSRLTSGRTSRLGSASEASFRHLPHHEPGWAQLFDRVVESGPVLGRKTRCPLHLARLGQPKHRAATAGRQLTGAPGTFCARCLSHLKLVSHARGEPEAKAYLLFEPLEKTRNAHQSTPA